MGINNRSLVSINPFICFGTTKFLNLAIDSDSAKSCSVQIIVLVGQLFSIWLRIFTTRFFFFFFFFFFWGGGGGVGGEGGRGDRRSALGGGGIEETLNFNLKQLQ